MTLDLGDKTDIDGTDRPTHFLPLLEILRMEKRPVGVRGDIFNFRM